MPGPIGGVVAGGRSIVSQPMGGADPQLRTQLARGGGLGLAGSLISAASGLVYTVLLARVLGDAGLGAALSAIALAAIATSLGKLGMDSTAIWLGTRNAVDQIARIRPTTRYMVAVSAAVGTAAGLVLALAGGLMSRSSGETATVGRALLAISWGVPFGVGVMVVLGATRGLGGIAPFVMVGNILVPVARPLLLIAVALAGGGAVAAAFAWAVPLPFAVALGTVVLRRQVRRHERRAGVIGPDWPRPAERTTILRYALPRTVSAGLEQALLWLDVLLVGALAGTAAAGVYGGASRFVAAGLIVDTALRVAVAPMMGRLLHTRQTDQLNELYRVATVWLVLFSIPVYAVVGVFAPTLLSWLGPEFASGDVVLVIMAVGASVTLSAGNVHSLLLMSGHSGWAAINKGIVVAVNVVGNLVLVPVWGIKGAALAWAAAMLLDAALALTQVSRFVGLRLDHRLVGHAAAAATAATVPILVVVRWTLGTSTGALFVGLFLAGASLTTVCWCWRDRFQFADITAVRASRHRSAKPSIDPERVH
jgi:O-antigen/teichoic acid export membrane protein